MGWACFDSCRAWCGSARGELIELFWRRLMARGVGRVVPNVQAGGVSEAEKLVPLGSAGFNFPGHGFVEVSGCTGRLKDGTGTVSTYM